MARVGIFVTDDVSGVSQLIFGLFPRADHQLCTVHLLRNAQHNLPRNAYARFRAVWREILAASSEAVAREKFTALLDELAPQAPAFIEHLRNRIDNYLAFCKYPADIQPYIRSTNPVEGLNNCV